MKNILPALSPLKTSNNEFIFPLSSPSDRTDRNETNTLVDKRDDSQEYSPIAHAHHHSILPPLLLEDNSTLINNLNEILSLTTTQEKRIKQLQQINQYLKHSNQHTHNLELKLLNMNSTCIILSYLLLQSTPSNNNQYEIGFIVSILHKICNGCSKDVLHESFYNTTHFSELLSVIFLLLQNHNMEHIRIKTIQLLRSFMKLNNDVKSILLQYSNNALLDICTSLLQQSSPDITKSIMGLLKDISFQSSNEILLKLYSHPNLLSIVLQNNTHYVSSILWNLVLSNSIQSVILKDYKDQLLNLFITILSFKEIKSVNNVLSTIGNLIQMNHNAMILCDNRRFIQLFLHLLNINNDNADYTCMKRRIIRIFKYIMKDNDTTAFILNQEQECKYCILPTLQKILTSNDSLHVQVLDLVLSIMSYIPLPEFQNHYHILINTILSIFTSNSSDCFDEILHSIVIHIQENKLNHEMLYGYYPNIIKVIPHYIIPERKDEDDARVYDVAMLLHYISTISRTEMNDTMDIFNALSSNAQILDILSYSLIVKLNTTDTGTIINNVNITTAKTIYNIFNSATASISLLANHDKLLVSISQFILNISYEEERMVDGGLLNLKEKMKVVIVQLISEL